MSRRRELLVALRAGMSEAVELPKSMEMPTVVHIRSVAEGQQFAPGGEVLMPFDMAHLAWTAYKAGAEPWAAYLQTIEPKLTRSAFENLRCVVPLEREALVYEPTLRLAHDDGGDRVV